MQVVYTYLTPTGKKNGLFCLTLNALLHREEQTVTCVKRVKNLTDYIKDVIQVNHFQHRLDTLNVHKMSKEQWNSAEWIFLSASFKIFSHRSKGARLWCIIPFSVPASPIYLTVSASLDFRAADVLAHDWMVMSLLVKNLILLFWSEEDWAATLKMPDVF